MKCDILIIGAGPAGLTAGIYAARAKRDVIILERGVVGGQQSLTDQIENYPGASSKGVSGRELSHTMEEQAKAFGVKFIYDTVSTVKLKGDIKVIQTAFSGSIVAKAVIIATGRDASGLGIPGEKEFQGKGVSYCATCDGAFFSGKEIAVVGGGNSALEEAIFLTKYASKVTIIHRRNEFRADKIVQDRVRSHDKISTLLEYLPVEVKGNNTMESLVLKHVSTREIKILNVSAVFFYVGNTPNTTIFSDEIKLNDKKYVLAGEDMKTNIAGVYVAGDVREKQVRQVVTAVSDGAIAAISADQYLDELV
ncbi:MAG: thioredoxin-disulfide reductase [Candidatus Margulisbacteria bacterium GWF2_35_9]|nr:MAG: thioredoxin-disulfide reductase [Candidatus Margulisbacteria bacterium GWF2_35_9]